MGYWNQPAADLAITHDPDDANNAEGYIVISRDNVLHYLHRWIWQELVGPIPVGYEIDHINRIRTDCELKNLRCVPKAFNLRNKNKRKDNVSGVTGVSLWKNGRFWRATITNPVSRVNQNKVFSVAKYGSDTAFQLACEARNEMLASISPSQHGYTHNHGD